MMTRKHFVAVAEIISDTRALVSSAGSKRERELKARVTYFIADRLASYFDSQNGGFDRSRFLRACGITD